MKKNKIFLFSAAALLALGLVGCATEPTETGTPAGSETNNTTATTPAEATIAITATADTVVAGEKIELTITTTNTTATPTVTVDDATKGEIVTENGKTYLKGKAAGTVKVTATVAGKTATKTFTVKAAPTVAVTAAAEKIEIGEETKLTITVANTTATPTVESSDTTIATVAKKDDGAYYVTGAAQGEVTITVTVAGKTATTKITVNPVLSVSIHAKSAEVIVGEKVKLVAEIENNVDELPISYTVSDATAAEIVEEYGYHWILGKKAGQITVTATVGTKTATTSVTINEAPALALEFYANDTAKIGEEIELNAFTANNTSNLPITYSVSPANIGEIITTYNYGGEKVFKFIGKEVGEGKIIATCGTITAESNIAVIKVPVVINAYIDGTPLIDQETEIHITTAKNPENTPVTVTSADTTAVTIRSEGGKFYLTGKKAGTHDIDIVCGETTRTLSVKILDSATASPVDLFKNILYRTIDLETAKMDYGQFSDVTTNADGSIKSRKDQEFNIYSDHKSETTTTEVKNKITTTTKTKYEARENGIAAIENIEKTNVNPTFNYSYKEYGDGDEQILKSDAETISSRAITKMNLTLQSGTVARTIATNLVFGSYYLPTTIEGNVTLKENNGTYTFTSIGESKFNYVENKTTFTLNADGFIDNSTTVAKKYKFLNPTAKTGKGELVETRQLRAVLTAKARVAGAANFIDETPYYATDYTPSINDGATEVTIGSFIELSSTLTAPETASTKVDEVTIESISPAENVAKTDDGYLAIKEGELTIKTISKNNVRKEIKINVVKPVIEEMFCEGVPTDILIDNKQEVVVSTGLSGLALENVNLTATLDANAPLGAKIEKVGPDKFILSSPNTGSATVTFTAPEFTLEGQPQSLEMTFNFVTALPITEDAIQNAYSGETYYVVEGVDDSEATFGYNWMNYDQIDVKVHMLRIGADFFTGDIIFTQNPETGKWDLTFTTQMETNLIASVKLAEDSEGNQILTSFVFEITGIGTFTTVPMA